MLHLNLEGPLIHKVHEVEKEILDGRGMEMWKG